MKQLLFFILFLSSSAFLVPVKGQCIEPLGIVLWPHREVRIIQQRQVFLLSAATTSHRNTLEQLGHSIPIHLVSNHDSVELNIQDKRLAADGTLQVLVRPARALLADTLYELRAGHSAIETYLLFQNGSWNQQTKQITMLRWRVAAAPDTQAPRWKASPAVVNKVFSHNSEGLENYVAFSYPLQDSSQCLIRATIRSKSHESVSYLMAWQNQLLLGWLTCGGNFKFSSSESCTVLFEAIDAAGNRASASGQPLLFQAPLAVTSP